jgi:hypothetical protein
MAGDVGGLCHVKRVFDGPSIVEPSKGGQVVFLALIFQITILNGQKCTFQIFQAGSL